MTPTEDPRAPVTLPVSTVASIQLPDVTVVRMHNVPGGINVHGLMDCLLKHFQFGPEYTLVSEYGSDFSGDIAAAIPTWCRSDLCIAELRAHVSDAKLASSAISLHLLWAADLSVSPTQHSSQGAFVPAQGSTICATAERLKTSLLTVVQSKTQAAKDKG